MNGHCPNGGTFSRATAGQQPNMVSREQVLRLVDEDHDFEAAGRRLGISPGLAYMIATGLPADGGDPGPRAVSRPGFLPGSTQHLATQAKLVNPTGADIVHAWIRQRASADLRPKGGASRSRQPARKRDSGKT
jgi:hypothetical protein